MRWLGILGIAFAAAMSGCGSTSTVTKTVTHTVTTASSVARAPVVVPFVQGLTEALAIRKVKAEGLVVRVSRQQHPGIPSGLVYDQSPSAGSHSRRGGAVTISVAKRSSPPKAVMVPAGRFYSPSGNIECHLTALVADCVTFNNRKLAEISQSGELSVLDASGSVGSGFHPGRTPVLPYGSTRTLGKFICSSASTGMTCKSRTTNLGFRINRDGIQAYPAAASNPPPAASAGTPNGDYSLQTATDDGAVVVLDDGSIWSVDDPATTSTWTDGDAITVAGGGGSLVDTDTGDVVGGTQIGSDADSNAYADTGDHSLAAISTDGSIITLDDGSVWEVPDPADQSTVSVWTDSDSITVSEDPNGTGYIVADTDDGSAVSANYIGDE